jgi:hypothetical protein
MNPLAPRLAKLERGDPNGWRMWEHLPHRYWPESALLALLRETEGWPPDYEPSEVELRAIAAEREVGSA